MEELIKKINFWAKKKARSDNENFDPIDHSGGNFNDAFDMGVDDGMIFLARELKELLKEVK